MILRASDGIRGELVDLETGQLIRKAVWANLTTGEFEAEMVRADGETIYRNGCKMVYRGRAKLQFIPARILPKPGQKPNARPVTHQRQRISTPLLNCRCEVRNCGRIAVWTTSDEVELAPIIKGRNRFPRAKCIARHFWCDFHYVAPRLYDAKGELISTWDEAGGVRPG